MPESELTRIELPPTPAYPTFSTNTNHARSVVTNATARASRDIDYNGFPQE